MNKSISAFSGASLLRFSSYILPAPENSLSDGTDVGGALRYFRAILARYGNRFILLAHHTSEVSLPNGTSASAM